MGKPFALLCLFLAAGAWAPAAVRAAEPDWSEGATIAPGGRANPHELPGAELEASISRGREHALIYPVEVTGALVPERAFLGVLDGNRGDPFRAFLSKLIHEFSGFRSSDQLFAWLGLHPYPDERATGIYAIPRPEGVKPGQRMGYGVIHRYGAAGFTFSCAACHSSNLFGRPVLGLTNRFPRANRFFILGKLGTEAVLPPVFAAGAHPTPEEQVLYEELRRNIRAVGLRAPQNLGLDTSLAQVALSLSRRQPDDYASRSPELERKPRPDRLDKEPADSKPAVWWNLKYKNRWLSDGSVVSGNPILTNLLWNEIGRGTDLRELGGWLDRNPHVIEELTSLVFSTQAPRFTDFFPASRIDVARARRGEATYNQRCAHCHGEYQKGWSVPGAATLPPERLIETVQVKYRDKTPVIDVGTDPARYLGMTSLAEKLNPLAISRNHGIVIKPQKGYVPPPLVGIWARWPYFHNNSAPSLCAVLSPAAQRPARYYAGAALDPERDFDAVCNGYPSGDRVPAQWRRDPEALYDTRRAGMGNLGHDERILVKDGKELMTPEEKADLIVFLQTL